VNKGELIAALAAKTDMSKTAAGHAVDAFIDIVQETVAKKRVVQLIGFGTFSAVKHTARKGRNPATGAEIKIAASTVPKFKPGAGFKAAVAK